MKWFAKSRIAIGLVAVAVFSACGQADAPQGGEAGSANDPQSQSMAAPIAVEFFTSQGCSSCPPADELAAELVSDPDLVIISRPVTYWDRLGWRDTLGREENSRLQRSYASRLRYGGGRAYTPQAVVDGRFGLIGSRRGELRDALDDAREEQAGIAISIRRLETGGSHVVMIGGGPEAPAIVTLVALDSTETVDIGAGENSGRSLTYTNIVVDERLIGHWDGDGVSLVLSEADLATEGADRHAIVVRQGEAGPIVAARYL